MRRREDGMSTVQVLTRPLMDWFQGVALLPGDPDPESITFLKCSNKDDERRRSANSF